MENKIMLHVRLVACANHKLGTMDETDINLAVDIFLDALESGKLSSFLTTPGYTIMAGGKKIAKIPFVSGQNYKNTVRIQLAIFQRMRKFISRGFQVSWIIQESIYYHTKHLENDQTRAA